MSAFRDFSRFNLSVAQIQRTRLQSCIHAHKRLTEISHGITDQHFNYIDQPVDREQHKGAGHRCLVMKLAIFLQRLTPRSSGDHTAECWTQTQQAVRGKREVSSDAGLHRQPLNTT